MKKIISIFSFLLLYGFIESNKIVFKSADGKTKITATKEWKAAGNMKGVEIYISRVIKESKPDANLVVSKDKNLPAGTDLSTYSAGKLFLQTSVLNSSPSFSGNKKIQGLPFIYYEYEYISRDFIKMKTLVYHTLVLSTGYQMVITAPAKGFDQFKPLFNTIGNSLVLEH